MYVNYSTDLCLLLGHPVYTFFLKLGHSKWNPKAGLKDTSIKNLKYYNVYRRSRIHIVTDTWYIKPDKNPWTYSFNHKFWTASILRKNNMFRYICNVKKVQWLMYRYGYRLFHKAPPAPGPLIHFFTALVSYATPTLILTMKRKFTKTMFGRFLKTY